MAIDRGLLSGSAMMLVLKLLDGEDMYGYQMIEELARRSDHTFEFKTGTLYPLLHTMEEKELISSYEKEETTQRPRRYYNLSRKGKRLLEEKHLEWTAYSNAVNRVMEGGALRVISDTEFALECDAPVCAPSGVPEMTPEDIDVHDTAAFLWEIG